MRRRIVPCAMLCITLIAALCGCGGGGGGVTPPPRTTYTTSTTGVTTPSGSTLTFDQFQALVAATHGSYMFTCVDPTAKATVDWSVFTGVPDTGYNYKATFTNNVTSGTAGVTYYLRPSSAADTYELVVYSTDAKVADVPGTLTDGVTAIKTFLMTKAKTKVTSETIAEQMANIWFRVGKSAIK